MSRVKWSNNGEQEERVRKQQETMRVKAKKKREME